MVGWYERIGFLFCNKNRKPGIFFTNNTHLFIESCIPSGKRLHHYGKPPFFMGKSTILIASIAILT